MKKLTLILSMMIALIGLNANAAMYIVGDSPFAGWHTYNGTQMTDNGDGTYSYTATINGTVWFVFASQLTEGTDDDWTTFAEHRYGPTGGDETVVVETEYSTQNGNNGAYKFTGSGDDYTFTFDEENMKFKIEGYVEPITVTSYTVAGSNANLFGTTWDPSNNANDMTLVNGLYTWSKNNVELTTSGFSFKVTVNHDWGEAYPSSDYYQAIDKHGYYDVVITFNENTKEVLCTATLVEEIVDPIIEEHTYTVAGTQNLFGSNWAPTDTLNDMTLVNGLYTWTKNGVELTTGNVEFKVVEDHSWDNASWPAENYIAAIEADDTYDVVITFDYATKEITFTATVASVEPPVGDTYTVAGAPAVIFGTEWALLEANLMTLNDSIYTLTKENIALTNGTKIEYKVVKNGSWATCYPAEFNAEYNIEEDAAYDIVFTFDPSNDNVGIIVTKHEDTPEPEMVYTVVGPEAVFGADWDATAVINDMEKGENDIYTWTKEEVTLNGNFSFKVVGNHDYAVYEWPMGYGNNYDVTVEEEGIYTIEITFDPNAEENLRIACTLTKTGDITPVEHVYTVAGTENLFGTNWVETDTLNDMTLVDGIYTWTKNGVVFANEDVVEFKVVQDHAWTYSWPSSNWYWQCTEDGTYDVVITFDPTADDMNKITFTATKQGSNVVRGDVDCNGDVEIADVTALINALLTGDWNGRSETNADTNLDGEAGIADVTTLISFLLTGNWPVVE